MEIARQQWAEGHRRLSAKRGDPELYRLLLDQVEAIMDELRRRIGANYSLADLADGYRDADRWTRDAVAEGAPGMQWGPEVTAAADAAFYLYARGARDYEP